MNKIKVFTIFGTRPEAIKMAPVVLELRKHDQIETKVLVTAQHREMLDQVLELFDITPDFDLNIMTPNQTLVEIESKILLQVSTIIQEEHPDIVLVHGDTTTAQASSLAAFFNQIPVGHVEAGLRTFNKYDPFPEEMNRTIIDSIADLMFAPTPWAQDNLLKEGKNAAFVWVTGNTVIDALLDVASRDLDFVDSGLNALQNSTKKIILVTTHRRENLGDRLEGIHKALLHIVNTNSDVEIVFPVHPNPKVKETAQRILGNQARIHLVQPLGYRDIVMLMKKAFLVVTDSGGLQEEAPSLGKPVLVLRKTTERPEGIEAGTVKLTGVETADIIKDIQTLLDEPSVYEKMSHASNPYGDGHASERIAKAIIDTYGSK